MSSNANTPSTGARSWPFVRTVAAFLACWLALAWPWLSGRVAIPWDAKAHFYPQFQFLAQSIARGESPFWAPFVFGGHPQIADPQSLIFSPPFLLWALFDLDPSLRAADGITLGMLALGGAFVIAIFGDRRWHPLAALVAAIVFAFGGSAAWRVQHVGQIVSLAWFPVAFWLLDNAIRRCSLRWGLAAGLVAGFMVAGRDQVAYLGSWVLAGSVVWRWLAARGNLRASLKPLAAGIVGGVLSAGVPVFLSAVFAGQSNRPAIDLFGAGGGSLHPALLLQTFVPQLFGASGEMEGFWGPPSFHWENTGLFLAQNMGHVYLGALPLAAMVLAGPALLAQGIRFWLVAWVVMLLYALGWYTPFFRVVFEVLPGVALFRRPADATFLLGGIGAILAGYALHRLLDAVHPPRPARWVTSVAILAVPFAIAIVLLLAFQRVPTVFGISTAIAAATMLGSGALLWLTLNTHRTRPLVAALLVIGPLMLDLAWNNGPNSATALPPSTFEPLISATQNDTILALKRRVVMRDGTDRRDRVELAGLGFEWPNAGLVHRLENTLGYNPLRLGYYAEATGAQDHVSLPDQRKFSALMPSYRSTMANLLGLRFIALGAPIETVDRTLNGSEFPLVQRTNGGFVYENTDALPRALVVGCTVAGDFATMIRMGSWPDGFDPRRHVVVEPSQPGSPPGQAGDVHDCPAGAGTATIASYRNDRVAIDVTATREAWLVLNDVWHPGWTAMLDGRPLAMTRANVLFRAVRLPAGTAGRIEFRFRPFRALTG